jgi:hypothetical protein
MLLKRCQRAEASNERLLRERERLLKALKIAVTGQQSRSAAQEARHEESSRPEEMAEHEERPDQDVVRRLQRLSRKVQQLKRERESESYRGRPVASAGWDNATKTRRGPKHSLVTDSSDEATFSSETADQSECIKPFCEYDGERSSFRSMCTIAVHRGSDASLSTWITRSVSNDDHSNVGNDRSNLTAVEPTAALARPNGARLVWGIDGDWRWEPVDPHWQRNDAALLRAADKRHEGANRHSSAWLQDVEPSGSSSPRTDDEQKNSNVKGTFRNGGSISSGSAASLSRSQAFRKALLRKRSYQ